MKIVLTIISIILMFSCSSNLPYADIYDVKKLNSGMDVSEVQNILGKPIQISRSKEKLVYKYDYRTLENSRLLWQKPVKGFKPERIGEKSTFFCKFSNNSLIEWGSCLGCCSSLDWNINTCIEKIIK